MRIDTWVLEYLVTHGQPGEHGALEVLVRYGPEGCIVGVEPVRLDRRRVLAAQADVTGCATPPWPFAAGSAVLMALARALGVTEEHALDAVAKLHAEVKRLGNTVSVLQAPKEIPMRDVSALLTALDAATDGDLILVHPGVYSESLLIDEKVKLQGFGPGADTLNCPRPARGIR